jgi:hypothetical protein
MICSEEARIGELDVSLLERLFERPLYIPKRRLTISSIFDASYQQQFPKLNQHSQSQTQLQHNIFSSTNSSYMPNGSVTSTNKRFTNLVKVCSPLHTPKHRLTRALFEQNYRSHPVILMPPSAMFYNDTLQPCAKNGTVIWSGLSAPHLPVKFIGHNHPEATNDEARASLP